MHNFVLFIADMPKIQDYDANVQAIEWDEVTLHVNFTGKPRPTIAWKAEHEDSSLDEDYAIEQNSDGSLLFVCVEKRHAGMYVIFILQNRIK